LILGPGQAKRELCHQIEQQGSLRGRVVGLYYASKLAKVELTFPISDVWRLGKPGGTQVKPLIPQSVPESPEKQRH
jgi:hypothetical protein